MRTKVKFNGEWYKPVPWLQATQCEGCALDKEGLCDFNTSTNGSPCNDGNEFSGMILIPNTEEGLAEYVTRKLGADDDPELE